MDRANSHVRAPLDQAMAHVADGDSTAFGLVFDGLWPPVLRYCQKQLNGTADAEDVAQRVMIRLFEQAPSFKPHLSAVAWAFTIAHFECRSERKRKFRAAARTEGDGAARLLAAEPLQDEQLVEREAHAALQSLLADLSQEERQLLLGEQSNTFGELSTGTAAELQVNPALLRKRRQRLLGRLKGLMNVLFGEQDTP